MSTENIKYRYILERRLNNEGNKFLNFILLNPSTADKDTDDPTVRACIQFAKNHKFDGFYITNLFAFRTKSPKELKKAEDPIGKGNDECILEYAKKSNAIVLGWGNHGEFKGRDKKVIELLSAIKSLHCLKITKRKNPGHPLYVSRQTTMSPFEP